MPDPVSVRLVSHADLGPWRDGLQDLFDAEYLGSHGPWDPDQPYGYAPAELHVLAHVRGHVVGHVGVQSRVISVGDQEVRVGGVGGVLVRTPGRGEGLGRRLLEDLARVLVDPAGVELGYLGCREEVVPFYTACGWTRVAVRESSRSILDGSPVVQEPGPPVLVHPARRDVSTWPSGDVDLRGRPW